MADSVVSRGRDTHANNIAPDKSYGDQAFPRLTNGVARIFTHLALPGVRGRTLESAILSVPVRGSWAAQTLTIAPIAESWNPATVTWNKQPTIRSGQSIDVTIGALNDGDRIEFDVTTHVQAVADGAAHYGWRITTDSGANEHVYGFDSSHASWTLTFAFVEAPEPPTHLHPNGGIQSKKPVLTFDFTDLGGDSTEQAACQVLIGHMSGSTFVTDWDSGEKDTTLPELDLNATSWALPAANTNVYWRVRVKDGAGYWSDYSDVASWTYAPKPIIVVDNPGGNLVWDPTPTIAFHVTTGQIVAYRISVTNGNDKSKVRHTSRKLPGGNATSIQKTLPLRNDSGKRILVDDSNYWLHVQVWDRLDRLAGPGDPTYTDLWVQFHVDDDAAPTPPDTLTAAQVGETPRVQLAWTRPSGVTTGWVVRRDGEVIARLDTDEVTVAGSTYSWVDDGASPWSPHTYHVKAIDNANNRQTVSSPAATITTEVEGLWLLTETDEVMLDGDEVSGFKTRDRRASYKPLNSPRTVDIVSAFEGLAGAFAGSIADRPGVTWEQARAVLMAMKDKPHQAVQLVYGTVSVPVELKNVSVTPSPNILPTNLEQEVSFDAEQVEDFEVEV